MADLVLTRGQAVAVAAAITAMQEIGGKLQVTLGNDDPSSILVQTFSDFSIAVRKYTRPYVTTRLAMRVEPYQTIDDFKKAYNLVPSEAAEPMFAKLSQTGGKWKQTEGELLSVRGWNRDVADGCYTREDGTVFWAKLEGDDILVSDQSALDTDQPSWATHVIWYPK